MNRIQNRRFGRESSNRPGGRGYGDQDQDTNRDYDRFSQSGESRYGNYGSNGYSAQDAYPDRSNDRLHSQTLDEGRIRLGREGSYNPYDESSRGLGRENGRGFYGKGPKGYKRSDERIHDEVCEGLFRDDSVDASDIEVRVQNGEVTLSGTVEDRRMKRAAEDCAESVSGVNDVHNELHVQMKM